MLERIMSGGGIVLEKIVSLELKGELSWRYVLDSSFS